MVLSSTSTGALEGDGSPGSAEPEDWQRLRKLLEVDERSRLLLDMSLVEKSGQRCGEVMHPDV